MWIQDVQKLIVKGHATHSDLNNHFQTPTYRRLGIKKYRVKPKTRPLPLYKSKLTQFTGSHTNSINAQGLKSLSLSLLLPLNGVFILHIQCSIVIQYQRMDCVEQFVTLPQKLYTYISKTRKRWKREALSFTMKDYNCIYLLCSCQSTAIYNIYNQTFLGFCTPSSQMQVKD